LIDSTGAGAFNFIENPDENTGSTLRLFTSKKKEEKARKRTGSEEEGKEKDEEGKGEGRR